MERLGLAWLAGGCVLLGLLPAQLLPWLRAVPAALRLVSPAAPPAPWWMLAPLADRQASYSPLAFFAAVLAIVCISVLAVRRFYHQRVRRAPAWDCGFGAMTARMQDTAEGFGQPIRHIFQPFFAMQRELPSPFDPAPRYQVQIADRWWAGMYLPIGALVRRLADSIAWVQQGRISIYLLYSFLTLLALLAFVL